MQLGHTQQHLEGMALHLLTKGALVHSKEECM